MDFKKLYYHLTAYIPRKLPTNETEFMVFKEIMLKYYGVKDEPQTYHIIASQIQCTPGHKLRKPYGHIANQVKRVKINAIAQCYRIAAQKEMEAQVAILMKKQAEAEETSTEQGLSDGQSVSHTGVSGTPI